MRGTSRAYGLPMQLDDDVQEGLERMVERSGQGAVARANEALRELFRYEDRLGSSIERGIADIEAGRVMSTEELVRELADRRRDAAE